jgi:hypothetical protein
MGCQLPIHGSSKALAHAERLGGHTWAHMGTHGHHAGAYRRAQAHMGTNSRTLSRTLARLLTHAHMKVSLPASFPCCCKCRTRHQTKLPPPRTYPLTATSRPPLLHRTRTPCAGLFKGLAPAVLRQSIYGTFRCVCTSSHLPCCLPTVRALVSMIYGA